LASETFVSAMMLITAVVACAILITAVFPIVWNMVSTFSSASHETDARMRTDFRIVATYAKAGSLIPGPLPEGDIYLKNVGTTRISLDEISRSDVFFGKTGQFTRLSYGSYGSGNWGYDFTLSSYDTNSNTMWDTGETIKIIGVPTTALAYGDPVYFQFVLPNSVERSEEFTVS